MTRLESIRAFVAVTEVGSFSAAAKSMGVSKSQLSRHVSHLERELGLQLILRTTRQLKLTEAGTFLFERCQRAIRDMNDAWDEVIDTGSGVNGRLRLLATDLFGERYIAPLFARISTEYPGLKVEVHIASEIRDLIAENYDLAIRYGDLPDSSTLATKIFDLPHVVVASPSYLASAGKPEQIDDLHDHNCLVSTLEPCTVWKFSEGGRTREVRLDGAWRSNNGPAIISACLEGLGLCRLPELYLRDYLASGELCQVLQGFESSPLPVWATFPGSRHVPLRTRVAVEYLRKHLMAQRQEPALLVA